MNGKVFEMLNNGLIYFAGRDRFYRPVCVFNGWKINSFNPTADELITTILFFKAYLHQHCTIPGIIENTILIQNLDGASPTKLPIKMIKASIQAVTTQEKCKIRTLFVLNAPTAISVVYKAISYILDDAIKQKIHILNSNTC